MNRGSIHDVNIGLVMSFEQSVVVGSRVITDFLIEL